MNFEKFNGYWIVQVGGVMTCEKLLAVAVGKALAVHVRIFFAGFRGKQ